jgi:hypothetical protein
MEGSGTERNDRNRISEKIIQRVITAVDGNKTESRKICSPLSQSSVLHENNVSSNGFRFGHKHR